MAEQDREERRLARLTEICLTFPEATRRIENGHGIFQVRKKTFAYFLNNHHGDGIVSLCCKVALGENLDLIALDPDRFYLPAQLGPKGWVALRLDRGKIDWEEVSRLVNESYRLVAPKRLAAAVS